MKKLFLLFLIPFIFISCKQEDNELTESPEEIAAREEFEYLKNYYNEHYLSKFIPTQDTQVYCNNNGIKFYNSISFEKDKIITDGIVYNLDLQSYNTFENDTEFNYYKIKINAGSLHLYCKPHGSDYEGPYDKIYIEIVGTNERLDYERDNSGGSSSETDNIKGSYNFNTASGYQKNGTVSLNDGNWSYSGEKTNAAATSGTYTVNGNKVTVNWVASGMDLSETFTVTTDGSSSTWVSDESGASPFLVMLFGTTDTQITFSYSE